MNKTITVDESKISICTKCFLCGSEIELTMAEIDRGTTPIKVCDQCKMAVKWAKERMYEESNG